MNNLDDRAEYSLSKSIKQERMADILEICAYKQRDLDRSHKWSDSNFVKFNKKCTWGGKTSGTSMCWRTLSCKTTWQRCILWFWHAKLNMKKQCAFFTKNVNVFWTMLGKPLSADRGSWSFTLIENSWDCTFSATSTWRFLSNKEKWMLERVQ